MADQTYWTELPHRRVVDLPSSGIGQPFTRNIYGYWTDTVVHLLSPPSLLLPLLQTLSLVRRAVVLTVLVRLPTSRSTERVLGVVPHQPVGTVSCGDCLFSYIG